MQTYLDRKEKLIPPIRVNTGPCKENIILGDDVDVLKFPIPLIHGGDGGRYIGTWHTVITKDPDSSWVNWGMYRLMVQRSEHSRMSLSIAAAYRSDVPEVRSDEPAHARGGCNRRAAGYPDRKLRPTSAIRQ